MVQTDGSAVRACPYHFALRAHYPVEIAMRRGVQIPCRLNGDDIAHSRIGYADRNPALGGPVLQNGKSDVFLRIPPADNRPIRAERLTIYVCGTMRLREHRPSAEKPAGYDETGGRYCSQQPAPMRFQFGTLTLHKSSPGPSWSVCWLSIIWPMVFDLVSMSPCTWSLLNPIFAPSDVAASTHI